MTKPYKVFHDTNDITDSVVSIDKCLDSDAFFIPASAQIMLTSRGGNFATKNEIEHFDRVKIEWVGENNYTKTFFVSAILPQASSNGHLITLELSSYESLLDKMTIGGFWRFASVKTVIKNVIEIYNDNRSKSTQPEIKPELNFADIVVGTFDFGDNITILEALKQLVAYLELSPANGGYGDRFSILFDPIRLQNNDTEILNMRIQPQGFNKKPYQTITPLDNRKKLTRTHDVENANITLVRGEESSGSIPTAISKFTGLQEEFDNFPEWKRTEQYKSGIHARYIGSIWIAGNGTRVGVAPNLNNSGWSLVNFKTYSKNIDYSPWTNGKADVYRSYTLQDNKALEQDGFNSPAFVDSNLLIEERGSGSDQGFIQQEVMATVTNFNGQSHNQFRSDSSNILSVYEGMKFLCLSVANGSDQKDKYNRNYKNAVIQVDSDGDWLVVPFSDTNGQPEQGYQVAVRNESKIYEWQYQFNQPHLNRGARQALSTGTFGWRDVSETPRTNHCFHYPSLISNSRSLVDPSRTSHGLSSVRVNYEWRISRDNLNYWKTLLYNPLTSADPLADLAAGLSGILAGFQYDRESYDIGWWCTLFETPSPITSYHGAIGSMYGNPVFDAHNVTYDINGNSGYNTQDDITLGTVQGFAFRFNFDVRVNVAGNNVRRPFQGDLPFRATIYDTEGNVWVADKTYRLLGESQDMYFYFDEFSIYYARAPLAIRHLLINITQPELLRTRLPERYKIKRIVLQLQAPYDDVGRYDPARYVNFLEGTLGGFLGAKLVHTGVIDAFRFVNTPIKRAGNVDDNIPVLNSKIHDLSNISNVEQLQKAANAQLELDRHKNDVISIDTRLAFGLSPGDAFYVNDNKIILDNESGNNTRKYIVTEINYTDSKTQPITRQINAHREVAT